MARQCSSTECQEFECRGHHWLSALSASTRLVTVLMPLALAAMACVCRSVMAKQCSSTECQEFECEATIWSMRVVQPQHGR